MVVAKPVPAGEANQVWDVRIWVARVAASWSSFPEEGLAMMVLKHGLEVLTEVVGY